MGEFDLIARIRARAPADERVAVGIGDDAAVLNPRAGMALVATTDTLVAGRHFRQDWDPADLGHLALAVNLSDLAAMGAVPRWALLAMTLPNEDAAWLDRFLDGFLGLAAATDCVLVGGNLAHGPLNITATALGEAAQGRAVTRPGARAGDRIAVTGTLGDAAAALALGDGAPTALRRRLRRPEPRLEAGRALAAHCRSMIDISDGLISDLGHLLDDDHGARVDLDALPSSEALVSSVPDEEERRRLQLTGGNDYELLIVLPTDMDFYELARAAGIGLSVIGEIEEEPGIRCIRPDGTEIDLPDGGWDHFAGG